MQDGQAENQHQRPHLSTAIDFLDGRDNRTQVSDRPVGPGDESKVELAARYTFSGAFADS
jgi:hypothetical protein